MKNPIIIVLVFILGLPVIASAQSQSQTSTSMFVFMDCNARNCDFDHFRREIPWVNWVRDRQDADLHILITSQRTAGGGFNYTLDYIGRNAYEGIENSVTYISDPTDTDPAVRNNLTKTIALGLVQFVINNPQIVSQLSIDYSGEEAPAQVEPEEDPWNLWVFRVGLNGSIEGESTQDAYSIEGDFNARRVSEKFKIEIGAGGEYDRQTFKDVDNGETFVNTSEDYSAGAIAVWSLSPKWSFGAQIEGNRSTFVNRDLAIIGGPAIEYNIFPYVESTRRSITFRYFPEVSYFDYELITIEGETRETLYRHTLQIRARLQQEWGEISGFVQGIQYFNDLETHRINTFLRVEYRLFRGFNVNIFMRFARIKDQFYLPASGLSAEEILLRRRQRETDYIYDFGAGFSYRFGSKFANIVNPRID